MLFKEKPIIFVTGKGGVGKSSVAAAIGWSLAQEGKKVCLFELGHQSFYEAFFETRGIGYEPVELAPNFQIALLTAESSVREYVLHYVKIPKLYELLFENRIMKTFLNAAPAVAELAIMGKITSQLRGILKDEYDTFVVDAHSTGHALALLRAPGGLRDIFKSGPLHEQAAQMLKIIKDPNLVHYVVVTLAEEMPVTESFELVEALKAEFHDDISLVVNRLLVPPTSDHEIRQAFEDPAATQIHRFAEFLMQKRSLQKQQLARIRERFASFFGVPIKLEERGQQLAEQIATHLEAPWSLTTC